MQACLCPNSLSAIKDSWRPWAISQGSASVSSLTHRLCELLPGMRNVLLQLPVSTIQSGPVNSLRGAAALTGIDDAIVIDIGEPRITVVHLQTFMMLRHQAHAASFSAMVPCINSFNLHCTMADHRVQSCGCYKLSVL